MHYSFLATFGLTEKEIALYELLLNKGQLPAGDIIKLSKIKRATAYQSLYALEKKGLVSQIEVHKKIHFKPESPTNLLELATTQQKTFNEAHAQLTSIISDLNSKYVLAVEKPVISVFEGVEGLKQIYQDMLLEEKPLYAALSVEEIDDTMRKWLDTVFVKHRAAKKIPTYVLVAQGKHAENYVARNKDELRTAKVVEREKYPFKHEIEIYGDKVAFINYRKGEHLLGVVVNHPHIAATMKALFDIA